MNISLHQTLASTLWPEKSTNTILRNVILAIAGSLLLWLSAKVQIPFYPVPMTMQTMVVMGLGAALGWRLATATMILYMLEGAAGLPVFAGTPEKGLGLVYMAGPTGGYLLGFIAASGVIGWLAEKGADKNVFKMFGSMLIGTAVIYLCGVTWLSSFIGVEKAIQFGVVPFLYGDLLKAALAASLFPAIWSLLKKK